MMRAPVLLVAALIAAAAFTSPQAVAGTTRAAEGVIYTDTGTDPVGDVGNGGWGDIRDTTRTLLRKNGNRYLNLRVGLVSLRTGYNPLSVYIPLDTRRGGKSDALMSLGKMHSRVWCALYVSNRTIKGRVRIAASRRIACRVPARPLRIDKRIRWKLLVREPDYGTVVDRAPNGGTWYR